MESLKFSLPNIWEYFPVYKELLTTKSDFVKDSVRIASVYGVFPNASRLAGGRFILYNDDKYPSMQDMLDTIEFYNNRGVSIRWTFNNLVATETDLNDDDFNTCLDIAHSQLNGVVVGSPIVEQYIKDNFPKYQIISSITNWNTTKQHAINELDRGVDLLVLNSTLVRDFDFVSSLDVSRVEILVNDGCSRLCLSHRRNHYIHESKMNLNFIDDDTVTEQIITYHEYWTKMCQSIRIDDDTTEPETIDPDDLDPDDLDPIFASTFDESWEIDEATFDRLVDLGITNFKFAGRDLIIPSLLGYYLLNTNKQHHDIGMLFDQTINGFDKRI